MHLNTLEILSLTLTDLLSPPASPLSRPFLRYSSLLKLLLVSRSFHSFYLPILYSRIFISCGNSQLLPLLHTLKNRPELAKEVMRLSFVSRHKEVKEWDLSLIGDVLEMFTELRELTVCVPTTFGLKEDFLSSKSLRNLNSLTLATPIRPPLSHFPAPRPPSFSLDSLSLLPSFSASSGLGFAPTFTILLSPRSPSGECSLSSLKNLSLADSHLHPLTIPPNLARIVRNTLIAVSLPRFTHLHSYDQASLPAYDPPEGSVIGGGTTDHETRFSCDPPRNLHPSRQFLDELSSSSSPSVGPSHTVEESKLRFVHLPNFGHLGTIHHFPSTLTHLLIGPTRGGQVTSEKVGELGSCLVNTKAELREIGLLFEGMRRFGRELEGMKMEVERQREECRVELRWI
ncbi:uncharacterized protein JCM6883_005861 [Sporobolomyces salmoneus]|uniref:uncharacterized protein n=1 Tax=Sporobolomyces salmoneus TaxID=183962 RepID=UPI0031756BBE